MVLTVPSRKAFLLDSFFKKIVLVVILQCLETQATLTILTIPLAQRLCLAQMQWIQPPHQVSLEPSL